MTNLMIFTDLDGTLLDHYDYNFTQALPALEKIRQGQIPLIINSSKTYAEIKYIRTQMHNNWAFSVENGAALFLPAGKLSGDNNNLQQIILGCPQTEILYLLKSFREQYGFSFKGFSDFSSKELMIETGLTEIQAEQAKERLASEPIKWLDSAEKLALFKHLLTVQGMQLIKGGRFLHVMGQNDKSTAMAWLLNAFNQQTKTIAIGDSQNDKKMLEQADFAAVIRKPDGSYLQLNKKPEQVIYSQHPAPLGWQEVIDQLLAKLNTGERNE